jgi:uncharacterized protein YggU (UPF0235/DUF167 family)
MDDHIKLCEELFSATRTEFKHLQHFYFHNCPYDMMWRDARFQPADRMAVMDILHTFDASWKLIFVGDASMSPYELIQPGGAIDSWNAEPGQIWLRRLLATYPRAVWLNPVSEKYWGGTQTIGLIEQLMEGRMFPLTLEGLDRAIRLRPGASRTAILGRSILADGAEIVIAAVSPPPEGGKANAALIALLAKLWRRPKTSLTIIVGATARNKVLHIAGPPETLMTELRCWLDELPLV